MNIVEKHEPREFKMISHNCGIILCDSKEGAFLVLRFPEDVERLKSLLNSIETFPVKTESAKSAQ